MKNKLFNFWIIIIITIIFLPLILKFFVNRTYEARSKFILGTIIEVTAADKQAFDIVFDEMSRVEKIFSLYNADSQISKLNSSGIVNADAEIINVFKMVEDFYQKSDGAFDISVGPASLLWKEAIKKNRLPNREKIKHAKQLINFNNITINQEKMHIRFLKSGMKVDLGGIAKGYAVDSAVEKLKIKGITSCLINAGGDIYCLGKKGRKKWRIGIQHPRNKNEFIREVELENRAIATSGDYEQFFIVDSKRFSHIINPITCYPADSDVVSATVLSDECATADALATSIFVLGKQKGLEMIKKYKDVDVIIFTKEDLDVSDN